MKPIVLSLCLAVTLPIFPVLAAEPTGDTSAVARVNGHVVTRTELDAAVKGLTLQLAQQGRNLPPDQLPMVERQVLDEIINRQLLLEEARKTAPADIDAKVDAELKQIVTQVGGEEEFKKSLAEAGFTVDQYRAQVRENLIIQEALRAMAAKLPQVTEAQAREFYDSNKERFKRPEMAHVRHILIRVPPEATDVERQAKRAQIDALRTRIEKGEDFAKIATENSEDPGSAPKGGDLGDFPQGAMVPEFDAVAFSLAPGKLSDVVTTQFGFHLLEVIDRKPAGEVEFAEVKERIQQGLGQQQAQQHIQQHVAQLRAGAKVDVLLPPLPETAAPAVPAPTPTPAPKP